MEAYLDNSATTRCSKAAADMVYKLLTEDYGNPSSLHMKGVEAENYINDAKKKIAKTLRVQDKEILFTSGGTESNNTAIIGAAMANKRAGRHIITSSVEHASVLSVMQFLEEQGFEITYLPVNHDGVISVEELKNAVREDTILVSLMHVNNEIGAVMPIEEAGAAIKEKNPATLFHVDAIQSYGKLEIRPKRMNIAILDDMWVTFNVREDLLQGLTMGTEFEAFVPALDKNIRLKVNYMKDLGTYAAWKATKTTGQFDLKTFEVKALPQEKVEGLRPGMSVILKK